jgi:uncharacterized membrane protein YoaT (DUF817 family)
MQWLPGNGHEWRWFIGRQALSSLFPVYIFMLLAVTHRVTVPHLYRYDLLLILCLAAQIVFLRIGYETLREFKVIMAFHLIGLLLEVYKTHFHSWAYPGPSLFHIAGVPLYSGFMYASVASYICQAWRRLNLRLTHVPNWTTSCALALAIYVNFFTERFLPDIRWLLIAFVFWHFRRTYVVYGTQNAARPPIRGEQENSAFLLRMPLAVGLSLVGLFVWFAENFGTICGAWQYPNQQHGWAMVHASKMGSWFLLVVIEFLIVARLKCRHEAIAAKDKIPNLESREGMSVRA